MKRTARTHHGCSGTTLVELVVAVSIMVVIMSTVLSVIVPVRLTFETQISALEAVQNGRILMDTLTRELSVARQITAVSEADDATGYIEFTDNDKNTKRFDINAASDYVQYGPAGDLADLAGPVSQLQFTCYDACDLDTPMTDVNEIRFIRIEATLTNSDETGQDKVFETAVFIWTDGETTSDSTGLTGWWCLDDGSGTTALDSSGNGNDGTLQNMIGNEWTTGVLDGALQFYGSEDYVDLPIGTLIAGTADCTITAWVNWSGQGDPYQRVFDFGSSTSVYMFLMVNNGDGKPQFSITDSGSWNDDDTDAPDVLTADWHHMAVTMDDASTTHTLYIDGEAVSQNTSAQYNPSDLGETTQNWLGRSQYGDNPYFDGILDDVRFYGRALSAEEISELCYSAPRVLFKGFEDAVAKPKTTSLTLFTPSGQGVSTKTVSFLGESVGSPFTVPAGSNRVLVFTAHAIYDEDDLTLEAVTYGGQAMTKVGELMEEDSGAYVVAYILNESGIASASGNTFVQTWSDTPDTTAYYSFAVDNAHQLSPLGDSAGKGDETDRDLSVTLPTHNGDMAVLAATAGNKGTYAVYEGFTEAEELSMNPGDGVIGYLSAEGDDVTPNVHHNNPKGQVILGFVIQADSGDPIAAIERDLLIAVLAIDEDETIEGENETLEAPSEEGWTLLEQGTTVDKVTVGVWAKLAGALESASHTFTWDSGEEGYGWIMRFTNIDPSNPLDVMEVLSGDKNEFPPSPSVTTTVNNTMILRIGGFNGHRITVGDTGLSGHTTITMNKGGTGSGASGGAAYKYQQAIGPSGPDTFELTGDKEYRTITIAIAPDTSGSGG